MPRASPLPPTEATVRALSSLTQLLWSDWPLPDNPLIELGPAEIFLRSLVEWLWC